MKGHKLNKILSRAQLILEEVRTDDAKASDTAGKKKLSRKSQRVADAIHKGKALLGLGGKTKVDDQQSAISQRAQGGKQENGIVVASGTVGAMGDGAGDRAQPGQANNYRFEDPLGPLGSNPVTWPDYEASERARFQTQAITGGGEISGQENNPQILSSEKGVDKMAVERQ
ncbi:hypothetical protein EG329_008917 [Mollisiaceae sp. DMI_Dod_QoI]|nr:hypothetical protein EG329_008917 [Helotiales sp. DMI_Dod_QoI]